MESVNIVIDDSTDVTRSSSEGETIDLTDEVEKQLQNAAVTPAVATETDSGMIQNLQLTKLQLLNQWTLLIKCQRSTNQNPKESSHRKYHR